VKEETMGTYTSGTTGDDTLSTTNGSGDTLVGGLGNDTYVFSYTGPSGPPQPQPLEDMPWVMLESGFGVDTVKPAALLAPGVVSYGVRFLAPAYSSDKAYFSLLNNGQPWAPGGESLWSLRFEGQTDAILLPIDPNIYPGFSSRPSTPENILVNLPKQIEFADGVVWTAEDIRAKAKQADQPGLMAYGTAGADALASKPDHIQVLLAGAGDDTLVGSAYNNWLKGEGGADTYVLGPQWGSQREGKISYLERDITPVPTQPGFGVRSQEYSVLTGTSTLSIIDSAATDAEDSTIKFTDDSNAGNLRFGLNIGSKDLTITRKDTGQTLLVQGFATYDAAGQRIIDNTVRRIEFADGTSITGADVVQLVFGATATNQNDTLLGGNDSNDFIAGLDGDDLIEGGGGNDTLSGDAGQDTLRGGAGSNLLLGGLGHDLLQSTGTDTLWGGQGNDTLQSSAVSELHGDEGDDVLTSTGPSVMFGGDGNDTLFGGGGRIYGGAGDDLMVGAVSYVYAGKDGLIKKLNGDDTYVFEPGFGHDVIREGGVSIGDNTAGTTSTDTIELASGFAEQDVTLTSIDDANIKLSLASGDDVVFNFQYKGFSQVGYAYSPYAGVEQIKFAATGQIWDSQAILSHLVLGARTLTGDDNANNLSGGDFTHDSITAQGGADSLFGLAGNDVLDGGSGDDWLDGGRGNDTLLGGEGADRFTFSAGDGQDVDSSLTIDQIKVSRADTSGGVLVTLGGADTIKLLNAGQWDGLKLMRPDGSVLMTGAQIIAATNQPQGLKLTGTSGKDTLAGKDGNDTLSGLAGNDSLSGLAGNDLIDGGAGADTLAGGLGNDRVIGGKGNDTYLFARGDGQDTVVDQDGTWFNSDLLKISGATSRQLWLSKAGSNLDISIIGSTDKVSIEGWFASSNNRVEKITAVGDGKTLSAAKVNALVDAMAKFAPPAEGQTTLPANVQTALSKVLASSWA
jgi:Ca2+-binding RTX toxin-like protein